VCSSDLRLLGQARGEHGGEKVIWWNHGCKAGKCSSAKVHGSLTVDVDGNFSLAETGVTPEIIEGF
jgi:CRISPR-associated protein Csd2